MELSPKSKKIINIVVDVIVAVVLAFALLLTICTITSKRKGYDQYTEIFGKAYLAVQSNSMEGDGKDNFSKGDLIVIKTVTAETARDFKVGDIITFKTAIFSDDEKMVLNTHRIIEVLGGEGQAHAYVTHGDNNPEGGNERVLISDVVGVYKGKAGGIGHVLLFMNSSAGFFVCIVLPTLLIVAYCAVNLFLVIRKEKKVQGAEAAQAQIEERERIRQELLAEMQGGEKPGENKAAAEAPPVSAPEEAPVETPVAEAEPAQPEEPDEKSAEKADDEEDKK